MDDDDADVYAALLATLEPGVLHALSSDFLHKQLVVTQQSVNDAAAALQRLREVTRAAQKLQLQDGNEQLHVPFKAVAKLQRRVTRTLKRVELTQVSELGHDAAVNAEIPRVQEQRQSQEAAAVADAELVPRSSSPEIPSAQQQPVREACSLAKSSSPDLTLPKPDRDPDVNACAVEKPREGQFPSSDAGEAPTEAYIASHLLDRTQSAEKNGMAAVEKPPNLRKRPRGDPLERDEALEVDPLMVAPDAKLDAFELYEALLRLKEENPPGAFVTLVEWEMRVPLDFQSSSHANQITAIRTLAAGIKALSVAPMCKHGSEITHKQRLMVAAVVAEAVAFHTKFVVSAERSSDPNFGPSELLAMLDCIGSTKIVFRDLKATMARLRKSEHELTEFVQQVHESEFQVWELDRKLTGGRRREFENMLTTLQYWIESQKCRGSALDRLMDQFESLLTKSLSLWDVTKDDTVRACVESMTAMASHVGGSIEKCAARLKKLEAFQNIVSSDVPVVQTERAIRAQNLEISRR